MKYRILRPLGFLVESPRFPNSHTPFIYYSLFLKRENDGLRRRFSENVNFAVVIIGQLNEPIVSYGLVVRPNRDQYYIWRPNITIVMKDQYHMDQLSWGPLKALIIFGELKFLNNGSFESHSYMVWHENWNHTFELILKFHKINLDSYFNCMKLFYTFNINFLIKN